jgi:bacteriorhodopsin
MASGSGSAGMWENPVRDGKDEEFTMVGSEWLWVLLVVAVPVAIVVALLGLARRR